MALKPTIYKVELNLSDIDRNLFDSYSLTLALHPSENLARMSARLLAFCFNAHEHLSFSKGLSSSDEPALWQVSLDDRIENWIDVGQPDPERLKKASGRSEQVTVYAFGRGVESWWALNANAIAALPKVQVHHIDWDSIEQLAQCWQRTLSLDVTITEGICYLNAGDVSLQITPDSWQLRA